MLYTVTLTRIVFARTPIEAAAIVLGDLRIPGTDLGQIEVTAHETHWDIFTGLGVAI